MKYIADKSALARLKHPAVAAVLSPLLVGGDVVTCSVIELEVLFSARTHADLVTTRARRMALPSVELSQTDFDRAVEVLETTRSFRTPSRGRDSRPAHSCGGRKILPHGSPL